MNALTSTLFRRCMSSQLRFEGPYKRRRSKRPAGAHWHSGLHQIAVWSRSSALERSRAQELGCLSLLGPPWSSVWAGPRGWHPRARAWKESAWGKPGQLRRRSIRLPGFDYTRNDSYFVTVCAANRACLFGRVINAIMHLSRLGQIVVGEWQRTAWLRPYVESDAFVVMPNHVHALFTVLREGGHGASSRAWKTGVARYAPTHRRLQRQGRRPYSPTPPAA